MQRKDPTFASKMLRCGSQSFAPSVQRLMENRLTEHLSKDQLLSGRSTLLLNVKCLSVGEVDLKKVLQFDLISYLRCALLNRYGVALRLVPHKPRSTADLLDSSKSWCRKLANGDLPCTCSELQAHMGTSVGGSHFVCRLKKSKIAGFLPQFQCAFWSSTFSCSYFCLVGCFGG